jgi:sugar/nucleoside kinase (ribokinase family)
MSFLTAAQRYDVITVGDVATDMIIRLPEERVAQRADDTGRWLEIPFGEKIAVERDVTVAAGGSAANAAVALARLGVRVGIAAFLAHDHVGLDLLTALHAEAVDTRLVHIDSPAHTNRNFVLSFAGDRTVLVGDSAFNYHWPHLRLNEIPTWLFLTSVGRESLEYQDQIAEWLEENPTVRFAFQPGTFQVEAGHKRLARLYARAELFVCTTAQAVAITGTHSERAVDLLDPIRELGPHQVVISDDAGGAVASDGTSRFEIPPFPDSSPPFDRLGASDAFGATLVAAFVRDMPLADALRWPPVNFMSVSHELGSQAGLLRDEDLLSQLDEVGAEFAVHSV